MNADPSHQHYSGAGRQRNYSSGNHEFVDKISTGHIKLTTTTELSQSGTISVVRSQRSTPFLLIYKTSDFHSCSKHSDLEAIAHGQGFKDKAPEFTTTNLSDNKPHF